MRPTKTAITKKSQRKEAPQKTTGFTPVINCSCWACKRITKETFYKLIEVTDPNYKWGKLFKYKGKVLQRPEC
jgi:hypothetical protein